MINDSIISNLLDKLVQSTQDKDSFRSLSDEQRAIAALELLIGTTTRSGLELFFTDDNNFLFRDAEYGLKITGVPEISKLYSSLFISFRENNLDHQALKKLQESIVVTNFDVLNESIKKYIENNFTQLSKYIL